MKRFLLDSGPLNDLLNRREPTNSRVRRHLSRGDRVGVCPPLLGEIVAGILGGNSSDRNLPRLKRALLPLWIWPFDEEAAWSYGELFAHLRKTGQPIPLIDIQIAAVALSLGKTTVVSQDQHFQWIPDLRIEDWSKAESEGGDE